MPYIYQRADVSLFIQIDISHNHMDYYQDEEFLGRRVIPGITPEMIHAELAENPLVYKYWKKNPEEVQQRLIDTFMRTPSDSDCPGFIYGFRNMQEYDPKATSYSIKMGRTKRLVPQQRIFQWQRDDCHQYVEMFTIRSEHNMKLQALVHLVFAYARKTKVINGRNRIEWFTFDEKVPTAAVTNLLNLMMESIHYRELKQDERLQEYERQQELYNEIVTKYNESMRRVLENLKRAVNIYAKGRSNRCVQLLKSIVNQESLEKMKIIVDEIVDKYLTLEYTEKVEIDVDDDKECRVKTFKTEVKLLKGSFEKLKTAISTIQQYESKYKLRFNSIPGRIKEAVYLGLKGGEELDKKVELFDLDKDENTVQIEKIEQKLVQKSPSKQEEADKIYKILYEDEQSTASEVRQQKQPKQPPKNASPKSQLKIQQEGYLSKNKLSQVYKHLTNVQPGETVINIVQGDFQIDCSKRVTHNMVLLASSVSVYNDWNVTFKTGTECRLNLVIMAKAYTNFEKIKYPKNPQNGSTSILLLNDSDELIGLDSHLKQKPEKLKSDFCRGIESIFRRNIK